MAIRFIIDSASDILPGEAKALGLIHLPIHVRFGEEEYADAVDLSHGAFYEKLVKSEAFPQTCQIPPSVFEAACEEAAAAGDEALIITLSSGLSGTCQSARLAAEKYAGRVFVVDSENVCLGERILVLRALALRDAGLGAAEIAARLEEERARVRLFALLDTLEYLKKGGRISGAAAFAGSLLSIKPVLSVVRGEVVLAGKARGARLGSQLLRGLVDKSGGIDFSKPFCLAYSGLSDALLQKFIAENADLWPAQAGELPICTAGCAIGAHAGPNAIAVAFFEK